MKTRITYTSVLVVICTAPLFAAHAAQDFQVRLLTPVASYSPAGTPFDAKILGSALTPESWTLPAGTVVHGVVREARSLGFGVKHERAVLELEFLGCELPAGETVDCDATLVAVDNAREAVHKDNRIEGILAAAHPHSWINGIWYWPTTEFFKRSPAGLTGAGGLIQSHLFPTPVGAALMIGTRFVLLRLPDPEILLPAGTDLILRVSSGSERMDVDAAVEAESGLSNETVDWLRQMPAVVSQPDHSTAEDLINVALFSTKEELVKGFAAAGWSAADPLTTRTLARTYSAFAAMRTYESAPVSSLYYQGRLPDLVFQKSFNSVAKRHHIRMWKVDSPEGPIWLSAATHDTSIGFDWKHMSITHRIDSNIDRERSTVINDLSEAGCLLGHDMVTRPGLSDDPSIRAVTDQTLAVGTLGNCDAPEEDLPVLAKHRPALPTLAIRRVILETRHYFTRGNAYYWAYRTVRWGIASRRKPDVDDE